METGLMIALGISLVVGILLIMFNSVSTEATKYRKLLEYIRFDTDNPLTEDELRHRLSLLQLDKYWTQLRSMMRYDITVTPLHCEDDHIDIACSKSGGFPHLPADEVIDNDFHFLMQINCSELKFFDGETLLPSQGMLYFFVCPSMLETDIDKSIKVRYIPSTDRLVIRRDISVLQGLNPVILKFIQTVSLPEHDTDYIQTLLKDYEVEGYFKLTNKERCHKISGYPDTITQHLPIEKDSVLLLQLDSDEVTAMEWGNMGRIYVCIDKKRLHEQQFDELKVYMQSY